MVIEILNGGEILVNLSKSRKSNLSVSHGTKSNWDFDWIWIPRYLAYKFKLRFLFNLNLQLTKISPPFRNSSTIWFSISSLIFHGTGCSDVIFSSIQLKHDITTNHLKFEIKHDINKNHFNSESAPQLIFRKRALYLVALLLSVFEITSIGKVHHDSFVCVTWLIHTGDLTRLIEALDSKITAIQIVMQCNGLEWVRKSVKVEIRVLRENVLRKRVL